MVNCLAVVQPLAPTVLTNCDVDCLYIIFLVRVSSCCCKAAFTQSHMQLPGCYAAALLQCVQHDKSPAVLQQGLSPVTYHMLYACIAEDHSGAASLSERAVCVPSGCDETHWAESSEGSSCQELPHQGFSQKVLRTPVAALCAIWHNCTTCSHYMMHVSLVSRAS